MQTTRLTRIALLALTPLAGSADGAQAQGGACPVGNAFEYQTGGEPRRDGPVDDPLYGLQWGMTQIRAEAAWKRGLTGKGVTIAVIDSGIDLDHPDLKDKLLPGIDFREGEGGDCADGPRDVHGHGTHVAGIAAASTDNGIGVAGVAPDAKILPIRICDADLGCPAASKPEDDPIVLALRHAADAGADVINLSLGGTQIQTLSADFSVMKEAVAYAWSKGAVIVAIAGNTAEPLCYWPASFPNVVCVAATDRRGLPAEYSGLPFDVDGVIGVRAPGGELVGGVGTGDDLPPETRARLCEESVYSTWWPGSSPGVCGPGALSYDVMSGTSMAAPHVSGLAALLAGAGLTNVQIVERIAATASNRGAYDPVMGYGIVDADAATEGLSPSVPAPAPAATAPRESAEPPAAKASTRCRRARSRLVAASRRATRARAAVRRTAGRRAQRVLRLRLRQRASAHRAFVRACG